MNNHTRKVFDIYEKYYDELLRMAVCILKNTHDAEEVLQDLAIAIIEKQDIFKNVNNYKAYLYTSTRNLAIDLYRKNKKHVSFMDTEYDSAIIKDFETAIENREVIEKLFKDYPPELQEAMRKYILEGYASICFSTPYTVNAI